MKGTDRSSAEDKRKGSSSPTPRSETDDMESHPLVGLQEQIGNRAVVELMNDRGQPLPSDVRPQMEASFGKNFSEVRIHQSRAADEATQRAGAAAFASGKDIYLSSDIDVESSGGKFVIGEELAHIAQGVGQNGGEGFLPPSHSLETEAHQAAAEASAGRSAAVASAPTTGAAAGRFGPAVLIPGLIGYGIGKLLGEEEEEAADQKPESAPAAEKEAAERAAAEQYAADLRSGKIASLTIFQRSTLMTLAVDPLLKAMTALDAGADAKIIRATNVGGIGDFLDEFAEGAPEGVRPAIMSASVAAKSANNSLVAAYDPKRAFSASREKLLSIASEITEMASVTVDPPKPEETKPLESLTHSEGGQLKSVAGRIRSMANLLKLEDEETTKLVLDSLDSIQEGLSGFAVASPTLKGQLTGHARNLAVTLATLKAAAAGKEGAVQMAKAHILSAVTTLIAIPIRAPEMDKPEEPGAPSPGPAAPTE